MVIREYPKEIKELMKLYETYKVKKWSWEQGQ